MIEKHHSQLSVRKQCELLAVNRNRLSPRQPKRVEGDEAIMKEIDRSTPSSPSTERERSSSNSAMSASGSDENGAAD